MKRRSRPISRVLSWTVIPLGAASPLRSSNLPGPDAGRVMRSLFGLAPGGVCRAGLLPGSRCALTAPFHPCLIPRHPAAAFPEGTWPMLRIVMSPLCGAAPGWRGPSAVSFCCTFRRLAPPRRYLAPCPVEPGLSSASFPMTRLSGRLRRGYCRMRGTAEAERRFTAASGIDQRQNQAEPRSRFGLNKLSDLFTEQTGRSNAEETDIRVKDACSWTLLGRGAARIRRNAGPDPHCMEGTALGCTRAEEAGHEQRHPLCCLAHQRQHADALFTAGRAVRVFHRCVA